MMILRPWYALQSRNMLTAACAQIALACLQSPDPQQRGCTTDSCLVADPRIRLLIGYLLQGLQLPDDDEEEEAPSSSAPIASPSVPKAGSILRHADGSGRESDDVVDGAPCMTCKTCQSACCMHALRCGAAVACFTLGPTDRQNLHSCGTTQVMRCLPQLCDCQRAYLCGSDSPSEAAALIPQYYGTCRRDISVQACGGWLRAQAAAMAKRLSAADWL